jgi:hypothetical protein
MVIANLVVSILGFFLRARLVQSHERTDAKSSELSDHEFGPVWGAPGLDRKPFRRGAVTSCFLDRVARASRPAMPVPGRNDN